MNPLVKITVSLLVASKRDGDAYLAKCPFLNIVTQGSSEQEALKNLKEEINFFFEVCCEDDSIVAAMEHRTAMRREPSSPDEFVKIEPTYLEIPANVPPAILRRIADAAVSVP